MLKKDNILKALENLRKTSIKRGFNQTADLIINFKDFNARKDSVNISIVFPHPVKKPKICAFLEKTSIAFDHVIAKSEFDRLNEKDLKKIIKDYDICVAVGKLMPDIAKKFGRILGPIGKMPDPKIGGVVMTEDEKELKRVSEKLKRMVKIRAKESSIKVAVGKEDMADEDIASNIVVIYDAIEAVLPKKKESVKNVMLKFTMSKPIKIK